MRRPATPGLRQMRASGSAPETNQARAKGPPKDRTWAAAAASSREGDRRDGRQISVAGTTVVRPGPIDGFFPRTDLDLDLDLRNLQHKISGLMIDALETLTLVGSACILGHVADRI